ncbi:hypothetical protein H072_9045 [Dactylellina haptotyla CBS 200.50]|uniref:Uncharacterized protein n=1 Tax=Dactylellina haptotyla (strain CBS 200.50) TaxID=1284197 RepID=S8BDN5_DACHA|nr:hypothetical protein H072_9045 [Dactylellina haptotyla CBS 200.50]
MDPRYPPHGDPQYGYSQRDGGYEEGQEGPWGQEQGQQYEDPSYADPAIDPGLESQSGRPTILPPGTLISGYRDYRPAGYSSYPSSSHSQQQQPHHQHHQQPPHEQHHQQHQQPHYDYAPYTYGGQDAASSYSPQHFTRPEAHRQQAQALERPRPEKKWLCQAEGCHRGMPGELVLKIRFSGVEIINN